MAELAFTWDSRDLAMWRGPKVEKALARALRLAGNQAFRLLERSAIDLAVERKRLPREIIAEDQSKFVPKSKDDIRLFAWKLFVRGKPVPAAKFPHNMSGLGTIVTFGGQSGTKLIERAFTASTKSGHKGVFRRRGKGRLPIDEVFSSRLPKKFGEDVMTTLADPVYRKLEGAYRRGLDRELGKLKRKGQA